MIYICIRLDDSTMVDWKKKYDSVGDFREGRAWVEHNGKCGYVDEHGNEVIPLKYNFIGENKDGRLRVELGGKYGFVDTQGNEVISIKYDFVFPFHKGKATIRIVDCWGEVDQDGKECFSPEDRAKLRKYKLQRLLKDL
jgi:hypothetical protein